MSNSDTLLLGAVAYDPKVVMIWDGFQAYLQNRGLPFDYILYSNYERQVAAQFAAQIHVAWNYFDRYRALVGRGAHWFSGSVCTPGRRRARTSILGPGGPRSYGRERLTRVRVHAC
jgi:hypothetical protein